MAQRFPIFIDLGSVAPLVVGADQGLAAHGIVHPDKKIRFQYTTSSSSLQQKLGVA